MVVDTARAWFGNLSAAIAEGQAELDQEFAWAYDMVRALKNESVATYTEPVKDFVYAIDWTERWLMGLGAFILTLYIIGFALRNKPDALSMYLFVVIAFVGVTQPLSDWALKNWQMFSNENYFYPPGLFLSIVYALPLFILAVLIIIRIFALIFQILVAKKAAQLKRQAKERAATQTKAKPSLKAGTGKGQGTPSAPTAPQSDSSPAILSDSPAHLSASGAELSPPSQGSLPPSGARRRKKKE